MLTALLWELIKKVLKIEDTKPLKRFLWKAFGVLVGIGLLLNLSDWLLPRLGLPKLPF